MGQQLLCTFLFRHTHRSWCVLQSPQRLRWVNNSFARSFSVTHIVHGVFFNLHNDFDGSTTPLHVPFPSHTSFMVCSSISTTTSMGQQLLCTFLFRHTHRSWCVL